MNALLGNPRELIDRYEKKCDNP